jgi:hypothetical protein
MSWFSDLTESVRAAVPAFDSADLLERLTLSTPELTAERHRIDAEERRKENVRNMLAGMLPWETRDAERDILVDECREAILQLSHDGETFFGPYPVPRLNAAASTATSSSANSADKNNDGSNTVQGGSGGGEDDDDDRVRKEQQQDGEGDDDDGRLKMDPVKPSKASQEKLAKLEPLPALLQHFDFQAHVGLIEKILQHDPNLVAMQSKLSGTYTFELILESVLFCFVSA